MTTYMVDKTSGIIAERIRRAEEKVARERGGFSLFGLFEREDVPGKWDLVAAAPWLAERGAGIKQIIDLVGAVFDAKDWAIIATVVPLETESDFVQAITRKYTLEHGLEEIGNVYVNGTYVNHAFLITANKLAARTVEAVAA